MSDSSNQQLTESEQLIAGRIFEQVFPDLVRLHFNSDVKRATAGVAA